MNIADSLIVENVGKSTMVIDTCQRSTSYDDALVKRIKSAFANFKTLTITGCAIEIQDVDPDNVTIEISSDKIVIKDK